MKPKNPRPLRHLFRDLMDGVQNLIVSEIQLLQSEVKRTAQLTRRQSILLAVSLGVAFVGLLPLVAFFVLALGHALGERYALSALFVSLGCFVLGGGLSVYFFRQIALLGWTLPTTRKSLRQESKLLLSPVLSLRIVPRAVERTHINQAHSSDQEEERLAS